MFCLVRNALPFHVVTLETQGHTLLSKVELIAEQFLRCLHARLLTQDLQSDGGHLGLLAHGLDDGVGGAAAHRLAVLEARGRE